MKTAVMELSGLFLKEDTEKEESWTILTVIEIC